MCPNRADLLDDSMIRVVLSPPLTFSAVAEMLELEGWEGGPITSLPPLIAGEPEFARWTRAGGTLRYEFNPVAEVRMVEVEGSAGAPPLPVLTREELEERFASPSPQDQLFGVLAARHLGPEAFVSHLERLSHAD